MTVCFFRESELREIMFFVLDEKERERGEGAGLSGFRFVRVPGVEVGDSLLSVFEVGTNDPLEFVRGAFVA